MRALNGKKTNVKYVNNVKYKVKKYFRAYRSNCAPKS